MPKAVLVDPSPPQPPPAPNMSSRSSTAEDVPAGMTEVQMRKKKNADAQAAFRQRRANYIATLEETVTSLEAVVIQLQDSCREARNRAAELERENARLKRTCNELWKTVGQRSRQNSTGPSAESRAEDAPPASPQGAPNFPAPPTAEPTSASPMALFPEDGGFRFPNNGEGPMGLVNPPYRSPTNPYPPTSQPTPDGRAAASFDGPPIQTSFPTYGGPPQHGREGAGPWPPSRGEPGPSSTSNVEGGAYVFTASRSMSPNPQSPPSSSGSVNPFPFNFGEGDRNTFDIRRSMQGGPEFLMHGGTADVTTLAQRAVAGMPPYLGARPTGPDQPELSDIELEGAEGLVEQPRRRLRRNGRGERSPSPSGAPISSTLAVIKAQAFGALRRTRAKTRKSAEGGAKIALQALQARGVDLGLTDPEPPAKRPRHDDPEFRDETRSPVT